MQGWHWLLGFSKVFHRFNCDLFKDSFVVKRFVIAILLRYKFKHYVKAALSTVVLNGQIC